LGWAGGLICRRRRGRYA